MSGQCVWSRSAADRAKDQCHDNGVIGVPEDRDEVGNQIKRHGEIGEKQANSYLHAPGCGRVRDEPLQQSQQIRQKTYRFSDARGVGTADQEHENDDHPEQQ
jgi:hypothetical protein